MLRVEMHDSINALIFRLEGRFTGEGAEHVRTLVTRCHIIMRLVVDLTEVTFIDSVGESVLSFFGRLGAELIAQTSYSLDVCERLNLRLARNGRPNAHASTHSHMPTEDTAAELHP
jgi:hypothetical protein